MHLNFPTEIFTYPDIALPEVWTVEQRYDTPALPLASLDAQVREALNVLCADPRLKPGASVALGVGSRGIANIALLARTVVGELQRRGMTPFVVPAMGSHGGATAEGQLSLLADYGVTPDALGCDLRATMETVELGRLGDFDTNAGEWSGQPIFWDKHAFGADAVIVLNRIKPHTDFSGPLESGLAKMSVIGLGKQRGAVTVHANGARGLRELIPRIARALVARTPLVGGIAIVENPQGQTAELHALPASEIATEREMALLRHAYELTPQLPFADLDVLIVDEMGKNISGTGMDTHVIGRALMPSLTEAEWGGPRIRVLTVLDLTAESHGNAAGLGCADITTEALINKVDWTATLTNTRTSGEGGVLKSRLPLIVPTPEDGVRTAIGACGRGRPETVRLARIRNTLRCQTLEISQALLEEARANPRLQVSEAAHPLTLP